MKHYVVFAAGSGITPILSIMKAVLQQGTQSEFTLFYGNQQSGHHHLPRGDRGLKMNT